MKQEARLIREYNSLLKEKEFKVWQVENDTKHWKAVIEGPSNSIYEGRNFQIDIKITEQYPFGPPKMRFDTKLSHPNISPQTGEICLYILRDGCSPAVSIRSVLMNIQAILTTPELSDSKDDIVTKWM